MDAFFFGGGGPVWQQFFLKGPVLTASVVARTGILIFLLLAFTGISFLEGL